MRYGTGAGMGFNFPVPGFGYLRDTRRNLRRITDFALSTHPDIVGLVEVDMGSLRSGSVNQAECIARALGHSPCYQSKYGRTSINRKLPIVRKQGNAFLTNRAGAIQRFHYFELGIKRLIMELELDEVCLFLVHLSLHYRHRKQQMHHLHSLVKSAIKPVVVAGDFNTLRGDHEMDRFCADTGLTSANEARAPTWPSRRPRREIDFILYGPGVEVTHFEIPPVRLSDHLPLVCDFELRRAGR